MVLKGLELAARDAARGVLTPEQKNDIRDTVAVLIAGLDRRETEVPDDDFAIPDDIPEAWKQDGAVLCVTGRSFVDESACSILAPTPGQARHRHANRALRRCGASPDRQFSIPARPG